MSSIKAIIPARSGSKRIPDKNICTLSSKTLISHAIEFALSLHVDDIVLSSDSDHYLNLHAKYPITLHKRSKFSSSDTASDITVLKDLLTVTTPSLNDICIWIRPTSPYRLPSECLLDDF